MTPHPPRRAPRRLLSWSRWVIPLTRATAALVAIALVVAGPPLLLLHWVGPPRPSLDWGIWVHGSIDDQMLISVLAGVVWIAWAQQLLCLLLEAAAVIRGAPPPHPPRLTFGVQQSLARALIGAVVAVTIHTSTTSILTAHTTHATTSGAPPPTVPAAWQHPPPPDAANAPGTADAPGPVTTTPPAPAPAAAAAAATNTTTPGEYPIYVVQPPHGGACDSLWRIAETHLRSPPYFGQSPKVFLACDLPIQVLIQDLVRSHVTERRVEAVPIVEQLDVLCNSGPRVR